MKTQAHKLPQQAQERSPTTLSSRLAYTSLLTAGLALLTLVLALTAVNYWSSRTTMLLVCRVVVLHNADVEPMLPALQSRPAGHGRLRIADEMPLSSPEIIITLSQQDGRIVFGISASAASKAGLTVSSRLLRLAKASK